MSTVVKIEKVTSTILTNKSLSNYPETKTRWITRAPKGSSIDAPLILFLAFSILAEFSITQDDVVERHGVQYWCLMGPPMVLIALNFKNVVLNLVNRCRWITVWALTSSLLLLLHKETDTVPTLFLWACCISMLSGTEKTVSLNHLAVIFIVALFVGVYLDIFTEANKYGLLFQKDYVNEEGVDALRMSLYPNVGYTGLFCFVFIVIFSLNRTVIVRYWWILLLSVILTIISNVRSINIALLIYCSLRLVFARIKTRHVNSLFWICLFAAVAVPLAVQGYELLYAISLKSEWLLRFLFRSRMDLNSDEISAQVFRPAVWSEHFSIFLKSDLLLGVGPQAACDLVVDRLNLAAHGSDDTVAFLTKLLAAYGVAGLLFYWQLIAWLRGLSKSGDIWACAAFPALIFLLMSWGSAFHPRDGFSVLILLIMIKGRSMFSTSSEAMEKGSQA
jgi:hypothetical protein